MGSITKFMQKPWLWSYIAMIAVGAITMAFTGGQSSVGLTQAALTFAAFSVIVGIGQMFVITLGPGNIDLSIPACMTLSGTVALKFMDTGNHLIVPGLLIAIGIGMVVGALNYSLIRLLRIPPIVATLSLSFIVQSTAIWTNRGLRIKPPENLAEFTTSYFFGVPNMALVATLLAIVAWVLLEKTLFGRAICAIGQNIRAARMAGIPVDGTRLATYMLCAVMAAIAGYFLASFSGGAALNMGAEYLLMSIAVVVIGGTSVAGGFSNVPGIWGASMFMFLVVSMLNTYGASAGVRLVLTGLIIIVVIIAASGTKRNA